MSDYTELKQLANHAIGLDDSAFIPCQVAFQRAANPHAVLALIAENDHLAMCARHWEEAAMQWGAERDRLKAENEALLKALDVAAARMLAAKVCFDRDYPGEWSGELHLAVAIKEIDAAMGKGEQS